VTEAKVVVLILLGIIKLVFGLAPLALARAIKKQKNDWWIKKLIGIVLCIGGGVLLSTVFIHMLKEVREYMERAIRMRMLPSADYPFAELIICLGFLLILLVESIVNKFFGGHGADASDGDNDTKESFLDSPQDISLKIPRVAGSNPAYDNKAYLEETPPELKVKGSKPSSGVSPYFANKRQEAMGGTFKLSSTSIESYSSATDSLAIKVSKTPGRAKLRRDTRKLLSSVRGVLVVVALSVHSLFEGMAVGLEETTGGVWQLFMAIAIHSTAVVFCIGTDMVSNGTRRASLVLSMVVLSMVTPLGVVIGLVLTVHAQAETGANVLLVGVLQGLAGGTLLYITFFEVLSRDKLTRYGMSGLMGALAIMLGFTVMAALDGLGGHSHGGGGVRSHQGHQEHGHAEMHTDEVHIRENLSYKNDDHVKVHYNPYDHFHEEYDLDHGDHVHHIEPHKEHDLNSEDDDDLILDASDFSYNGSAFLNINKNENHQDMNHENLKAVQVTSFLTHHEHVKNIDHDHSHHENDYGEEHYEKDLVVEHHEHDHGEENHDHGEEHHEHDHGEAHNEHDHGEAHHEHDHGEAHHEHDRNENIFDYDSLVT